MRRNESQPTSGEMSIPYEMISLESLGSFMMFGEIDPTTAFVACEFVIKANMLQQNSNPLTFLINSPGGSVNDGFAIIDLMETSRLPIHTIGTGVIASMALLILAAGEKGSRVMTKNTQVMAHQWFGGMEGKFHELMAVTEEHKRLRRIFINHFLRHSTMSEKEIVDVLFSPSDRWLTPKECLKYGLVDHISDYLEVPEAPVKTQKKTAKKSKRSAD